MPQWTERVTSHPIFLDLTAAQAAVSQAREQPPEDAEGVAALDRLSTVVQRIASILQSTDASLITPSVLSNVHSSLQAANSELRSFLSNREAGHLNNANSHIDNLLPFLAQIPFGTPGETLIGARDAVENLRGVAAKVIESFSQREAAAKSQLDILQARVNELVADIASQKVRLDSAIAQQQDQFAAGEAARRNSASETEAQRAEAARAALEERRKTFDAAVTSEQTQFQALREKEASSYQDLRANIEAQSSDVMTQMNAQLERATAIVGIISESGIVHGYRRVANEERSSAGKWHLIAGGSMVGLIGFAIFAFIGTLGKTFDWGTFGGRAFVAITFGIMAAYGARQADKHEQVERRSRRLELELAALDPFLEPLPEADRIGIKKLMADRLFGQPDLVPSLASGDTTGSVVDLLKLAIQGLSKK